MLIDEIETKLKELVELLKMVNPMNEANSTSLSKADQLISDYEHILQLGKGKLKASVNNKLVSMLVNARVDRENVKGDLRALQSIGQTIKSNKMLETAKSMIHKIEQRSESQEDRKYMLRVLDIDEMSSLLKYDLSKIDIIAPPSKDKLAELANKFNEDGEEF